MKKLFYKLFSKAERALMMKDRFRYGFTGILRCGAV